MVAALILISHIGEWKRSWFSQIEKGLPLEDMFK
jgi:hypothetical protein